jgi:hypothetical protein
LFLWSGFEFLDLLPQQKVLNVDGKPSDRKRLTMFLIIPTWSEKGEYIFIALTRLGIKIIKINTPV